MYHILTENKNLPLVKATLRKYLQGWNIMKGEGCWVNSEGKLLEEDSLLILVYHAELDKAIKPACRELCRVNDQERIDILNVKNGQIHHVGKV